MTEGGSETRTSGIFSRRTAVVAPGKQRIIELLSRTCLMIESPMISVVGGGGGDGAGRDCDGGGACYQFRMTKRWSSGLLNDLTTQRFRVQIPLASLTNFDVLF